MSKDTQENRKHSPRKLNPKAVSLLEHNDYLASKAAEERIEWAFDHLPDEFVMSSSFGAQSAAMLHLVTQQRPKIPVIVIDTGHLFPDTYRFIDQLTEHLGLNLKVYRSELSPAWQEARYGKRWQDGLVGLEAYNQENKIKPMELALRELAVGTWFAGLRRSQGPSRQRLDILTGSDERWKVHPIVDWTDRDVYRYLTRHDLPYHPLWHEGYVSIGDVHTTRSLREVTDVNETRFFGLKRECGLHEIDFASSNGRSLG
jgi:phosphoadenosine phosphosulfate reductase